MATIPYFILGPNTLLSLIALWRGKDKTIPTPLNDWTKATVDVVIPAYNEQETIILCLESLSRQTLKPNRIILIDDASRDRTSDIAKEFAATKGMNLEIIKHRSSVGKTPGVKQEARELTGDVEFVLDGDTILESENYLARVVEELYKGVGTASACGTIMPLKDKDRDDVAARPDVHQFYQKHKGLTYHRNRNFVHRFLRGVTNQYREFLYYFLQNFIYHGQMVMFGSIVNPVGCAVAYRRLYIKNIFDKFEEPLGDNLTTSEDIFIGFALQDMGYHNVQVHDVLARSEEPEAQVLPNQVFLWSSSFLQSCYYFPELVKSPFKFIKRWRHERQLKKSGVTEKRKIQEAYRQPFGVDYTKTYGRPIGWTILLSLLEKVTFPLAIIIMIVLHMWEALFVTLAVELLVLLILTAIISKDYKWKYVGKALTATPVRYITLLYDFYVVIRFIFEILFVKEHKWRK